MTSTKELIRFKELKELLGISRTTLWRWERKGKFPKHFNLGDNIICWRRSEIEEWIKQTNNLVSGLVQQQAAQRNMYITDNLPFRKNEWPGVKWLAINNERFIFIHHNHAPYIVDIDPETKRYTTYPLEFTVRDDYEKLSKKFGASEVNNANA